MELWVAEKLKRSEINRYYECFRCGCLDFEEDTGKNCTSSYIMAKKETITRLRREVSSAQCIAQIYNILSIISNFSDPRYQRGHPVSPTRDLCYSPSVRSV